MKKMHKLTIHSLDDCSLSCSCGLWNYSFTGRLTKEQAIERFEEHKKQQYSSICQSCEFELELKMMTGYVIQTKCDRCGNMADLAIVHRNDLGC